MQIIHKGESVSYSDFQRMFPKEANILTSETAQTLTHVEFNILIESKIIKIQQEPFGPVAIDIDAQLEKHRVYFYKSSPYKELLAKALGLKPGKEKPKVLDATGGMLGDSLLIYALGVKSLAVCERNPIAGILIANALERSNIAIDFHFLSAIELGDDFDVIYFDPMYVEKNTKSQAKKEMVMFRSLIGADEDAQSVAKKLLDKAGQRLVIKRSVKASSLLEKPHMTFKGKSTAYDVYLKH